MAIEAASNPAMGFGSNLGASVRPLLLMVGMAAAVAAGVGITLWSQGPTYGLLYGSLADTDAAAVTRSLSAAGIEYRLDDASGGISVPASKLNEARMLLAEQGVLDSGGFASLAKENGLGISTFMESARYQHALEMELSKTIASMQHVASARVHIAAPRQSSFIRDRTPARASVFLQLRAGRRLTGEQVSSIVNLVGSSVPDIDPSQVTVIDQQGRLLSAPEGRGEGALRDQQLEYTRQIEENLAQRIEALITPMVGIGRVRAEVSADFDMTSSEEAREQFSPDGAVVRSEQVAEERGAGGARGVPGAAANQINAAATGAGVVAGESVAQTGPVSVQSTRNFEIDRTVSYLRQPGGRLTRLSVAVLVDNPEVEGPDGSLVQTPLTPEQIERITLLVKDAVGFNEARGDRVSVVNSAWRGNPSVDATEVTGVPVWEQAWFIDVLKALAGLVALIVLIFTVIKPMVQRFNALLPAAPPPPDANFMSSRLPVPVTQAVASAGSDTLPVSAASSEGGRRMPTRYDEQIDLARSIVNEDPARVAQVVKKWAMNNG